VTCRVLVVEDERMMRTGLERALRGRGCEVVAAATASDALAALDAEAFDVVVLDVRLGEDENGLDVAEAAWRRSPAPAVVVVSGKADREEAFRLGQLGVRAFIDKADLGTRMDEIVALADRPTPLGPHIKTQVGHATIAETVQEVRDGMLEQALGLEDGSCTRASERLRVSRQAVQQMVRRRRSEDDG